MSGPSRNRKNSQEVRSDEIRITYSQVATIITIIGSIFSGILWISQAYSNFMNVEQAATENTRHISDLEDKHETLKRLVESIKNDYIYIDRELRRKGKTDDK